jgi:membrane-bound lytic murein transglycosylase D
MMRNKIGLLFCLLFSLITKGQITGAYQPAYDFKQIDSLAKTEQGGPPAFSIDPGLIQDRLKKLENAIPLNYNIITHQFVEIFAFKKASFTQRMLEKKDIYFPIYEKYLKKYDLPDELKYLSLIESGLENKAISNKGAGGLWQFMPHTARGDFGMRVDQYIDERFDAERATDAACQYLKRLYKTFGDWHLALAAYNTGPANVKRAIRRCGGANDFWGIYACLPAQTKAYVPQFIAMTYMMNYHWDHSIQPENWVIDIPKDSILVSGYLNLNTLSRLTGFSLDTLRRLNPHIISHFLPKNSQQVKVHLPSSHFSYFEQNRARIMDSARVDLSAPEIIEGDTAQTDENDESVPVAKRYTYRVKKGDNLSTVSRRLGVSVIELKRLNRIKGSKLRKGQVLTYFKLAKPKQRFTKRKSKRLHVKIRKKVKHKKKKSSSKKRHKRK